MGEISQDIHQASLNGASSPTSTPSDLSLKNKIRAKQIAQGLMDGKTYTQIAKDIGLSRPALYAIMDKHEVQTLMERELRTLETTVLDWIMDLKNSKSVVDKRIATQELAKITKHYADKLYPNLLRTETVTINIDLQRLQTLQHIITETLNRLPPSIRSTFWTTYKQVTDEHQTPT